MSPLSTFEGFPPGLHQFFVELRANNDRDWFNANKPRYIRDVREPVRAFIDAIRPRLAAISPSYRADSKTNGGSMFRIYRDIRFAKDKRPYKEHAACQFRHLSALDAHAPGFYVHLAPHDVRIGGGIWRPPAKVLHRIREGIVENPINWAMVKDEPTFDGLFEGLEAGDPLRRVPRGFDPESIHAEDLKRRTLFLIRDVDPASIEQSSFIDAVDETFQAAAPLMRFICEALELPP